MTALAARFGTHPIAPWRHTARIGAVLSCLAIWGAVGAARRLPAGATTDHVALYVSALVTELLLLWGAAAGLDSRSNGGWRAVLGSGFFDRRGILADLALASVFQAVWIAVAVALGSLAGKPAVSGILPKGAVEIPMWILLSISAGICEEFAFRGYFMRQFLAFSRNPAIALAAQALLFGAIHSYQGPSGILTTAAYGAMMGLLTLWRGNLRAAMAAHALTDLMVVLWAR